MEKEGLTIVIFGGTGDLTKRKIVPALTSLINRNILKKDTSIIGVSRKSLTDEEYKNFLKSEIKENHFDKINVKYFKADISKKESLKDLNKFIKSSESKENDRIFYLSTSFKLFPNIVNQLKKYNLNEKKGKFTRIVFEKPFGEDLKSSNKLESCIHKNFKEDSVYRLDHYLAKETVQNINILKFSNPIIENIFNNQFIKSIEIIAEEDLSVGDRIGYYDEAGAIKDMIQNHLLQTASLVLMDEPKSLSPSHIHDEKVKILKNIKVLPFNNHLLGQYKSYKKEALKFGIKNSKTETFAKIVLNCKTKKWKNVDIILKTGKNLKRKTGLIIVNFKPIEGLFENEAENNKLIFHIYPTQDVIFKLNSKDFHNKIQQVDFEFCHECYFGPNTKTEYETLFHEVIKGDNTLFTRSDELRESWKITDKIIKMKNKIPFKYYENSTDPDN
jgi:glucose-6-phosphate 1-dehydrogenase